jgi:hypothetical protein
MTIAGEVRTMTARVVFTSGFSRLGGVREFTVEA